MGTWIGDEPELADAIGEVLEAASPDGLTPSKVARKAKLSYEEASRGLDWMVANHYARISGAGAWCHYHAGRSSRYETNGER